MTLADVAQAVARRHRLADLIPAIHEQALRITSGRTSVLLRPNPATRKFHGISAAGLEQLDGEPWFIG